MLKFCNYSHGEGLVSRRFICWTVAPVDYISNENRVDVITPVETQCIASLRINEIIYLLTIFYI
ncbi:MAG: hypothetical protein LBT09_10925 [Planctomycetaceae bacterium]|nr:hypothetical protein [Planctomycetaceae bacterium]